MKLSAISILFVMNEINVFCSGTKEKRQRLQTEIRCHMVCFLKVCFTGNWANEQ